MKSLLRNIPPVRRLLEERQALREKVSELEPLADRFNRRFPPGHFHSPIPDESGIEVATMLASSHAGEIPGVDLNRESQLRLLAELAPHYHKLPFGDEPQDGLRYYYSNPHYSYTDANFLACLILHLKPKRIVEVGSGFSSAVILDINDHFFDSGITCTFIEPYPELTLRKILKTDDEVNLKVCRLQDIPLATFEELEANDILFLDSTHVSKVGSDVNYFVFEIFPRLASGVYIHIHDIFYPFEYPKEWFADGIAWNEAYILRAFLQFNQEFEIKLFSTYLHQQHPEFFMKEMPRCLQNSGGSIWLKRL